MEALAVIFIMRSLNFHTCMNPLLGNANYVVVLQKNRYGQPIAMFYVTPHTSISSMLSDLIVKM